MNIFQTSLDPVQAARWLCREHLAKMPLESAQLISTAISNLSDYDADWLDSHGFYKPTHQKHPSTRWIEYSRGNLEWLIHHVIGMENIYKAFNRTHKSFIVAFTAKQMLNDLNYERKALTPIYLAMDTHEYADIKINYSKIDQGIWIANTLEDGVLAYQEYVRRKVFKPITKKDREAGKLRLPTWNIIPTWYTPSCTLEGIHSL